MTRITRLGALLLLLALSDVAMARPRTKEVKLITEPRPGEEYVMFQSGTQPRVLEAQRGSEFATSHRIPQRDRAAVEKEILDIPRGPRDKVKRDSPADDIELVRMLGEVLLTPDATLPRVPGEVRTEFSVVTSVPRRVVASEPGVEVEPKGGSGVLEAQLDGADEKKIMVKKAAVIEQKPEEVVKREQEKKKEDELAVEVMPVAEVGVTSPKFETHEGDISVPPQKKQTIVNTNTQADADVTTTVRPLTSTAPLSKNPYDLIPVNILSDKTVQKDQEKDSFAESPLGDKMLVPAGSAANPQSRIEVKKGPNGQDYEYEYVYYYYDDEDNETAASANEKPADSNLALPAKEESSSTTATTTTTTTTTTEKATTPTRRFAPREKDSSEETHTPVRSRSRTRGQASRGEASAEEVAPSKTASNGSRHRYTTIERNRAAESATTVTPESSNEVIPSRSGGRFRGRTLSHSAEEVSEERLPSATRFPTRSTTQPAAEAASAPRSRASSSTNSVRRPSLELVDSRSFRTYSSDASPDQDLAPDAPAFPSVLPAGPVRFLGVTPNEESSEREVSRPRIRPRGHSTTSTTAAAEEVSESEPPRRRRPSTTPLPPTENISVEEDYSTDTSAGRSRPPATTDVTDSTDTEPTDTTDLPTTVEDVGLTAAMMDKAAFDLYAILQQTQAENASNFIDETATDLSAQEDLTTEEDVSTTDEPATTTVTTTTTTTTTTTPAPTTTTTEPPTTPARRGGKKRPGSGASPGRSRFRASTTAATSTTEAPAETSSNKPRNRFGSNRSGATGGSSFGSRRASHKKAPSHDEDSGEKEAVKEEAAPKPSFSRRFNGNRGTRVTTTAAPAAAPAEDTASTAARPTPPNDRFSIRRRAGVTRPGTHSTTAAPATEEHKVDNATEEGGESSSETSSTAAPATRPVRGGRPAIGGGPRPLRPGPRINIASRGRLGPSTSTTAAPVTEAEAESKEEQSSPATSEEKETQPDNQESQDAVTTTPVPSLTRLRNRPRLHVTAAVKPNPAAAAAAASSNRRALVSPLLSRRRPGAAAPAEPKEPEAEEHHDAEDESESAEKQHSEEVKEPSTEVTPAPATTAAHEHENKGLSSLIAGRRRPAARRPGALFPGNRAAAKEETA